MPNPIEATVKPAIILSDYQKKFCRRAYNLARGIRNEEAPDLRHIVLDAKAGSGKTSTITFLMKYIPVTQKVVAVMFNKRNADEIQSKLPKAGNCEGCTTHSLGSRICRKNGAGRLPKDGDPPKMTQILKEMQMSFVERALMPQIKQLVSVAKAAGLAPKMNGVYPLVADTDEAWEALVDHYNIEFDELWQEERATELARQALRRSIDIADRLIDFDDMLYLPVVMRMGFHKYDWVFVDEAQDLSGIQHEIVKRSVAENGHLVAVGDPNQCQPLGTIVRTPEGNKYIQDLKDGDRVVTADISHSCFKASGETIKIARRDYDWIQAGKLIRITSAGRSSRYTPNHRCIASCKPLADKYVVYLMQKGRNFRIGSTKFGTQGGSGPRTRMLNEGGESVWLLAVHDNKQSATLEEASRAYEWGISERTFVSQTADGTQGLNDEFLGRFWASIPDHREQALALLRLFSRHYEYPFFTNADPWQFAVRRPSEIFACNLMPGMLVLHESETIHYRKHQWKAIKTIERERYHGPVYSLDVADKGTYIADGIATHNSIYQFRGASSDSMATLKRDMNAHEMPLSICYRCDKAIVREAQRIVPAIEDCETRGEGIVDHWSAIMNRTSPLGPDSKLDDPPRLALKGAPSAEVLQAFSPESVILCPMNAPLVTAALGFIRNKVACQMLGRDFSKGLIKLLEKLEALDAKDAEKRLDEYEKEEGARLSEKQNKLQVLQDKCATLRAFLEDAAPNEKVDRIVARIQSLFTRESAEDGEPQSMLTLCTIHKSKGGEWERVFLLESGFLQSTVGYKGKQLLPWEIEQRRNLLYVAITRAEHELIFIGKDDLEAVL